jgi:hypothetical protein
MMRLVADPAWAINGNARKTSASAHIEKDDMPLGLETMRFTTSSPKCTES